MMLTAVVHHTVLDSPASPESTGATTTTTTTTLATDLLPAHHLVLEEAVEAFQAHGSEDKDIC